MNELFTGIYGSYCIFGVTFNQFTTRWIEPLKLNWLRTRNSSSKLLSSLLDNIQSKEKTQTRISDSERSGQSAEFYGHGKPTFQPTEIDSLGVIIDQLFRWLSWTLKFTERLTSRITILSLTFVHSSSSIQQKYVDLLVQDGSPSYNIFYDYAE